MRIVFGVTQPAWLPEQEAARPTIPPPPRRFSESTRRRASDSHQTSNPIPKADRELVIRRPKHPTIMEVYNQISIVENPTMALNPETTPSRNDLSWLVHSFTGESSEGLLVSVAFPTIKARRQANDGNHLFFGNPFLNAIGGPLTDAWARNPPNKSGEASEGNRGKRDRSSDRRSAHYFNSVDLPYCNQNEHVKLGSCGSPTDALPSLAVSRIRPISHCLCCRMGSADSIESKKGSPA